MLNITPDRPLVRLLASDKLLFLCAPKEPIIYRLMSVLSLQRLHVTLQFQLTPGALFYRFVVYDFTRSGRTQDVFTLP